MKQAGKLLVLGLLKSFICIFFVIGVGALSYKAVIRLLHIPEEEAAVAFNPASKPLIITEASIDDVSKNLIYSVDEEDGEINRLLLEIFRCGDQKLYYITIPIKTQVTLSDSLYKKLVLVSPTIPQVMKLSTLYNYFPKDTIYEYGVLVLEDLLGIKLSYYTVIPQNIYQTMFVTRESADGTGQMEVFTEDYIAFLDGLTTEESLKSYIEELYRDISSNLSVTDKMNYLDSYLRTSLDDITYGMIPGVNKNSGYYVDRIKASGLLSSITDKTTGD